MKWKNKGIFEEQSYRTDLDSLNQLLAPEIEIETATSKLKKCYKYVYVCKKCKRQYGTDIKEKLTKKCPECSNLRSKK